MLLEVWTILIRKDNGYIVLLCVLQRSYDTEKWIQARWDMVWKDIMIGKGLYFISSLAFTECAPLLDGFRKDLVGGGGIRTVVPFGLKASVWGKQVNKWKANNAWIKPCGAVKSPLDLGDQDSLHSQLVPVKQLTGIDWMDCTFSVKGSLGFQKELLKINRGNMRCSSVCVLFLLVNE